MVFRRNFSVGREDELIAEIERLRAALQKIARGEPNEIKIAREALNGPSMSNKL